MWRDRICISCSSKCPLQPMSMWGERSGRTGPLVNRTGYVMYFLCVVLGVSYKTPIRSYCICVSKAHHTEDQCRCKWRKNSNANFSDLELYDKHLLKSCRGLQGPLAKETFFSWENHSFLFHLKHISKLLHTEIALKCKQMKINCRGWMEQTAGLHFHSTAIAHTCKMSQLIFLVPRNHQANSP